LTTKSSWPQIVDRLSTYNKPIRLNLRKNVMRRLSDINEHLLRLTNLSSLTFHGINKDNDEAEWFKLTSLPNLQSVEVGEYTYDIPLEPLLNLRHLTNFCHPYLDEDSNPDTLVQSIHGWTNLESCSIVRDSSLQASELFQSYHSRLTRLSMYVPEVKQQWFEHLDKLKELDFTYRDGENAGNLSLKRLTSLEQLVLSGLQLHELNSKHLTRVEIFEADERVIEREIDNLVCVKNFIFDLKNQSEEGRKRFSYEWLAALTALEDLNIDSIQHNALSFIASTLTSLQFKIDDTPADLPHLSKFACLKELYLIRATSEHDVDISEISKLTTLESLQIDFGSEIPFVMSILSNLTWLHLAKSPAEVSHLPKLEYLILHYTSSCHYTGFEGLQNLTALELATNFNDDYDLDLDYKFISRLTTLKYLRIGMGNGQKFNCQYFSALTALERLHLAAIESEDDYGHIAGMTKLTELQIRPGRIESPKILHLPTSLQVLHLDLPDEKFIEELKKRLPNLYKCSF
jgi:hypothetical protein